MRATTGTRAEVERLRDLDAKANGLPRRGEHVGAGPHVRLGDTPGPGWTTHVHDVLETDRGGLAYPVETLERVDTSKLTAEERTEVQAAIAAAEDVTERQPAAEESER